jgi:hypothetical protein
VSLEPGAGESQQTRERQDREIRVQGGFRQEHSLQQEANQHHQPARRLLAERDQEPKQLDGQRREEEDLSRLEVVDSRRESGPAGRALC